MFHEIYLYSKNTVTIPNGEFFHPPLFNVSFFHSVYTRLLASSFLVLHLSLASVFFPLILRT